MLQNKIDQVGKRRKDIARIFDMNPLYLMQLEHIEVALFRSHRAESTRAGEQDACQAAEKRGFTSGRAAHLSPVYLQAPAIRVGYDRRNCRIGLRSPVRALP